MVTRRGWLLVGCAVALLVCGRILGIAELFGLAVAAVAIVVAARVHVGRGPGELVVSARVAPGIASIGESARIDLHVDNTGRRTSRAVTLRTLPYRGNRTPIETGEVAVPPLVPDQEGRIVLGLRTTHRGAFELAGVSIELEDPLGLACRREPASCDARLVVLPVLEQLEDVAPFSGFAGRDEALRSTARRLGSGLSSFRQYSEGDDLRLVHWKTTARIGELMVREGGDPEAPESLAVTVVLDSRRTPHTAATFETAVSAAASVLDTCAEIGATVRLVTTAGVDTGWGADDDHLERCLVELAIAEPRSDTMSRALRHDVDGDRGSGLLVLVTTDRALEQDVEAMLRAHRARTPVVVRVAESAPPSTPAESPAAGPPVGQVWIPAGTSVRAAWIEAFGRSDADAATPRGGRVAGAGAGVRR